MLANPYLVNDQDIQLDHNPPLELIIPCTKRSLTPALALGIRPKSDAVKGCTANVHGRCACTCGDLQKTYVCSVSTLPSWTCNKHQHNWCAHMSWKKQSSARQTVNDQAICMHQVATNQTYWHGCVALVDDRRSPQCTHHREHNLVLPYKQQCMCYSPLHACHGFEGHLQLHSAQKSCPHHLSL